MAKKSENGSNVLKKRKPALDPNARQSQMVSYAVDLVEKRLREGTASSAETCHYLKLGSAKAKLEEKKLEKEIALLEAKASAIEDAKKMEVDYEKVLKALREYNGAANYEDI